MNLLFLGVIINLVILLKWSEGGFVNFSDVACGTSKVDFKGSRRNPKIVGGDMSYPGEWPWVVSIKKHHWNNHICGGVLISKNIVLTVAHCLVSKKRKSPKSLMERNWISSGGGRGGDDIGYFDGTSTHYVAVGEYNIDNRDNPKEQIIQVKKWVAHPAYNESTMENDIAIIFLEENVSWGSRFAVPACIWDGIGDYPGKYAEVAGWGRMSEEEAVPSTSDVLRKVKLEILEVSDCQRVINEIGLKVKLRSSQICGWWKDGGKDSCSGDSGGPMMVRDGKTAYVIGLVSTGKGCARKGYPGIYTRLSSYLDWIRIVTKEMNQDLVN